MNYNITITTANLGHTSIIGVIIALVTIAATVMLFRKAGREGWEAIIPIYNGYTEYKLFWTTKMFWATLAVKAFTVICLASIAAAAVHPIFLVTAILGIAGAIASIVLSVKKTQKIAHAFNRRGMFVVGLFFFGAIFRMILAFNKDEYVGANL